MLIHIVKVLTSIFVHVNVNLQWTKGATCVWSNQSSRGTAASFSCHLSHFPTVCVCLTHGLQASHILGPGCITAPPATPEVTIPLWGHRGPPRGRSGHSFWPLVTFFCVSALYLQWSRRWDWRHGGGRGREGVPHHVQLISTHIWCSGWTVSDTCS